MRLQSIHVENFGKLSNLDIDLHEGKNVYLRENGYGKTTLATFIRVMFYGFNKESAKKLNDRERYKYKPWNGGAYGGTITFNAGSKTYTMRRRFTDKASNDEFELRDAVTNMPSSDYTSNIGEELFLIDAESFENTVYIGQNSVMTSATDNLTSHMTTGTAALDDLGKFDLAIDRIKNETNALSEKRATGELYKDVDELQKYRRILGNEEMLSNSYKDTTEKIAACNERIKVLKQEEGKLYERQQEIAKLKDLQLKKQKYEGLDEAVKKAKARYEDCVKAFPGKPVKEATVEEMHNKNTEMISYRSAADAHRLSDDEIKHLIDLQDRKRNYNPNPDESGRPVLKKPVLSIILIVLSVLGIGAGVCLIFLYDMIAIGAAVAGASTAIFVIAIILMIAGKSRYKRDIAIFEANLENERKRREEIRQMEDAEIERLVAQRKQFDENNEKALAIRDEIVRFLTEAGITPDKNLTPQLVEIENKAEDYGNAVKALNEATENFENFIKITPDIEEIKALKEMNSEDELMTIHERMLAIGREEDEINGSLKTYNLQIEGTDGLMEKLEEVDDAKAKADALTEEIDAKRHKVDILNKTDFYLKKAKENFVSNYTAPVLDGFNKYYAMFGNENDTFYLDTDINLTKEELGAQREIDVLSSGNRDMVGLALRMAFVSAMTKKEQPFIIMDDPFVNLDTEKVERAKHFLDEVSKEYQVIYLTCYDSRA